MKKYLLLILLFINCNSFSQGNNRLNTLISKIDSIYTWKWNEDSAAWEYNIKQIDFSYDADNNITSKTFQLYSNGNFTNRSKQISTYDGNNNLLTILFQVWDGTNWVNDIFNTYTYDANNNQTLCISQIWNGTSFIVGGRITCNYNSNNDQTSYLAESYNGTSWDTISQRITIYNIDNKLLEYYTRSISGGAWINNTRIINTYDVNNNLETQTQQKGFGTVWVNLTRLINNYDANNLLISTTAQIWYNSAWVTSSRTTNYFDTANNLISYLMETVNGSQWDFNLRYNAVYDSNNNIQEYINQRWDNDDSLWLNEKQFLADYNVNNFQYTLSNKFFDSLTQTISSGDSTYYYMSNNSGLGTINNNNLFKAFPNPTTDKIYITASDIPNGTIISISDFQGKDLKEIEMKNNSIDISALSPGVYILKAETKNKIFTEKIIKL